MHRLGKLTCNKTSSNAFCTTVVTKPQVVHSRRFSMNVTKVSDIQHDFIITDFSKNLRFIVRKTF